MAEKLTYSFKDIQAAIIGPGVAINLGDGSGASEEGIDVDPSGDINTMTIGADGSGQHSLAGDRSGRITARFLKTSPTNALLAQAYAFQTASAATHGQNTITLVDSNRGDVITCQQCAFGKAPPLKYGKEAGMVEWEFQSVQITRTLGGL